MTGIDSVRAAPAPHGLPAIFAAFFRLGITSFGGGTAAWLYRDIVERRGWIDDTAFLSGLALSRVFPGSGGVNLTVLVGQRLRGAPGAVAAVAGLLSGPLVVVLSLAIGWAMVRDSVVLHGVLDGVGAAAIGFTLMTGVKLMPRDQHRFAPFALVAATVLTVGVLRWPMIPVVLALAPIGIGLEALTRHRAGSSRDA